MFIINSLTEIKKHKALNSESWKEKLMKLEASICEGLQTDHSLPEAVNLFGRKVSRSSESDLSFISGLTLCGLRTNALIENQGLAASNEAIRSAIRQHLPLSIHVNKTVSSQLSSILSNPEFLAFQSAIQFVSSSTQDVLDFALIMHKVSEIALTPAINQICITGNGGALEISAKQRVQFLGNADDQIESPTPSQRMIFGQSRRRIPQWFNYDYPAELGSLKDKRSLGLEYASRNAFFTDHLEEIISDCLKEFESISGRRHDFLSTYNVDKSPFILITFGCNPDMVSPVIDELGKNKIRTGLVNINIINPFPKKQILDLIRNKKAVTILEPMGENHEGLAAIIQGLLYGSKNLPFIIKGYHNGLLKITDLLASATNMTSGKPKSLYYCGLEFTRASSDYPKYQVMLQEIKRNYPLLERHDLAAEKSRHLKGSNTLKQTYSSIVRQYRDQGAPFTQLSRFKDNTALFYQVKGAEELVADPFQSILSVPSASASLDPAPDDRELIPLIDPVKCTACGSCMINCPHSALPSVSIGIEKLLRTGMEMAASEGTQVIHMIPLVKSIAKIAEKVIHETTEAEDHSTTVEELLMSSFDRLLDVSKIEGEKLESLKVELNAVKETLGVMPLTVSTLLYQEPESQQKGSGELFFIAVDPNVCTGCQVCFESCDDGAIEMVAETEEILSRSNRILELWEKLPDTSADTINKLLFNKNYNSFAALMMSRNFYHSITGGGEEPDTPDRQMVHLITTATESLIQPRYADYINKINSISEELSSNIHSILSESLPKENFDNIAKAIGVTNAVKVPFDEILSHIGSEERLKQVDAISLKRKIELLNSLKGLAWSLSEGPTGAGRARMGMSISGNDKFGWANSYPYNPFISPVLNFNKEFSPDVILGLLDGQLRNVIDNIKLIRRANLEIKNKYNPKEHDKQIALLNWESLDAEEKKLIPPVLFISQQNQLSKSSFHSISKLLSSDKPVKIFVIDDLLSDPGTEDSEISRTSDLMSIIGLRKAFVYQGSMAKPGPFFNQMIEGINSPAPAYFRIYSPDPDAHIYDWQSWPSLNFLASNSRAFPFLTFNPEKYKGFLNNCISIDDNTSHESSWISESLTYKESGEEKTLTFNVTWADWAFGLKQWASHFKKEDDENKQCFHISEFISSDELKGTPVIFRVKDGELIRYSASNEVLKKSRVIKESWDLLRELSGNLVEFPEKLALQINNELKEKYDAELESVKQEFNKKLKEQEQIQIEEIRKKLRDKLVQLTTKKKKDDN